MKSRSDLLAVLIPFAIVAIVDLWIVSAGRWTRWPEYSALNDTLADAFRHGQTSLLKQPPPELVALANPYDARANRAARESGAHDLALFRGRYYLYWGPVPALLLAAVKSIFPGIGTIGDQYLAYAFA